MTSPTIKSAIEHFLQNSDVDDQYTTATINGKRFIGFHQDQLHRVDFIKFRTYLLDLMNIEDDKIVQIIGDSNQYSKKGTIRARTYLSKFLNGKHLIEYGYTGHLSDDQSQLDINSLLNKYLEKYPNESKRVLGNLVSQSIIAIEQWNCTINKNVRNFVIVYNGSGLNDGYTCFGDDIIISDNILQADKDCIVVIGGGIQSFIQCVDAMSNGVKVYGITNCRTKYNRKFFSTVEFFL